MPESVREIISDFLAQKRIAMIGASRKKLGFSSKLFSDLRKSGYDIVPVNPGATEIDGVKCYARVQDIQPPVDAALVMTRSELSEAIVKDCIEAGIHRVWLYRATGKGAVSDAALACCAANQVHVVPGGCPYMFMSGQAWFHRMHGYFLRITGGLPA